MMADAQKEDIGGGRNKPNKDAKPELADDLNSQQQQELPLQDPPSPSEATPRAILACIGAFFALFTSVGFLNAWGIFQEYYGLNQLSNRTESEISWIGSFAAFMQFMGAAPAGFLADKIGPMPLIGGGSIGVVFSMMMTSLCTQYYQLFLAQGLLSGLSMAFLTIPAVVVVNKHFSKHRGLATGSTIAGSSVGGIVWPIVLEQLLNKRGISFGWTLRAVGFIMIVPTTLATLLIRPPLDLTSNAQANIEKASQTTDANASAPKSKKLDFSIVRNPTYILFVIGVVIFNLALFSPFFYLTSYAISIGMSTSLAFYLLSILSGASMFGRIGMGMIADKYGPFNLAAIVALASALVIFCWTAATTVAGVVIWAIAAGFTSGAFLSLQIQCAAHISTPKTFGTAMGLAMGFTAITNLVGNPINGALIPHGYLAVSMFSGAVFALGGVFIILARLSLSRDLFAKV